MALPYGATLCNECADGDGEGDEEECGPEYRDWRGDAYKEVKRVYGETVLVLGGACLANSLTCMATYYA